MLSVSFCFCCFFKLCCVVFCVLPVCLLVVLALCFLLPALLPSCSFLRWLHRCWAPALAGVGVKKLGAFACPPTLCGAALVCALLLWCLPTLLVCFLFLQSGTVWFIVWHCPFPSFWPVCLLPSAFCFLLEVRRCPFFCFLFFWLLALLFVSALLLNSCLYFAKERMVVFNGKGPRFGVQG